MESMRNSQIGAHTDLAALDKLVTSILMRQPHPVVRANQMRSSVRSRSSSMKLHKNASDAGETNGSGMPTILETNNVGATGGRNSWSAERTTTSNNAPAAMRQIINTIANAPNRFSLAAGGGGGGGGNGRRGGSNQDEENLTTNMID